MEAGLLRRSDRVLPKLAGQAKRACVGVGRFREPPAGAHSVSCACRCSAVSQRGTHRPRAGAPAAAGDLHSGAAGRGGACVPEPSTRGLLRTTTPGPGAHAAPWQVLTTAPSSQRGPQKGKSREQLGGLLGAPPPALPSSAALASSPAWSYCRPLKSPCCHVLPASLLSVAWRCRGCPVCSPSTPRTHGAGPSRHRPTRAWTCCCDTPQVRVPAWLGKQPF